MSNLFKKYLFTFLGSYAIFIHLKRFVYEIIALNKMQTSISRVANSIFAAVERDLPVSGLVIDVLRRESLLQLS